MSILGRLYIVCSKFNLRSFPEGMGSLERIKSTVQFATMYKTTQIENPLEKVRVVDFRSDTVSKPTDEMRHAMYEAEVGDDVMGEDPTVNALEKLAANIFGKEASIYITSGTMGNLIATMVHCNQRGSEIIVGDKSHMLLWEQSGAAQLAGVQMTTVKNLPDGTWSLEEMLDKLRDDSNLHTSQTALICVENTHNWCGGRAMPLPWLVKLAEIARDIKIPLHMDGARVFNAALCSGISVAELVKDFSSVSVCLSKGLGAPIGSMLIGDNQFINKARRMRKVLGGGWRQAGVVAAAGLYALEHMVDRLAEDHARAKAIAQGRVRDEHRNLVLLGGITWATVQWCCHQPSLPAVTSPPTPEANCRRNVIILTDEQVERISLPDHHIPPSWRLKEIATAIEQKNKNSSGWNKNKNRVV